MRKCIKIICVFFIFVFINLGSLSAEENFEGFPKKIVFGTYPKSSEAELVLNEFQKYKIYTELEELAKKNNFNVHILPFGKSSILVIEPLANPTIHKEAHKIIKKMFKDAYDMNADGTSESVKKSTKSVKNKKQSNESGQLVKSDIASVQENKIEEEIRLKEQKTKENESVKLKSVEKVQVRNTAFSVTEFIAYCLLFVLGMSGATAILYSSELKLIFKKK